MRQKYQPIKAKIFSSGQEIKYKSNDVSIPEAISALFPVLTSTKPAYVELFSEGEKHDDTQNSPLRVDNIKL